MKPVQRRQIADADIASALVHYLAEAPAVAPSFIDELQHAFRRIQQFPAAGSPRFAHELAVPGLRCVQLRRFPYLVLYVDLSTVIDVWRVLHAQRDIPTWMGLEDPQ